MVLSTQVGNWQPALCYLAEQMVEQRAGGVPRAHSAAGSRASPAAFAGHSIWPCRPRPVMLVGLSETEHTQPRTTAVAVFVPAAARSCGPNRDRPTDTNGAMPIGTTGVRLVSLLTR
jgi:hypothetical protein